MTREFTCIVCPNGCEIRTEIKAGEDGKYEICSIDGALCSRGEVYVKQELTDPRRSIATSVLVKGGVLPLASVRLTNPIPKDRILHAVAEVKKYSLTAPVASGTVVIKNILGYDSDVIVTKEVPACEG